VPGVRRLPVARVALLRLLGLARPLRHEEWPLLAPLVLALLDGPGVELRTLLRPQPPGGRGVLLRHVDALAGVVGQADARAEVGRAVRALESFDGAGGGEGA
jgi:hypothetical protein